MIDSQYENILKKFILSGATTEKFEDRAKDVKKTLADRKKLLAYLTKRYNGESFEFEKLPPTYYEWFKKIEESLFVRTIIIHSFLKKIILLGLYTQEIDQDVRLDVVMSRRKNFYDFCRGTVMECPEEYQEIYKSCKLFCARPKAEVKNLKGFTKEHQKYLIHFLETGKLVACPEAFKSCYSMFIVIKSSIT